MSRRFRARLRFCRGRPRLFPESTGPEIVDAGFYFSEAAGRGMRREFTTGSKRLRQRSSNRVIIDREAKDTLLSRWGLARYAGFTFE